ncbi:MAG: hypothetical protein IJP98_00205 [Clostridia bacterium]|nr:hypothetical protein [Clostridia bacterium]
MNDKTIPIVLGVSGHLTIREEDREPLKHAVAKVIATLRARCPATDLVMLNSLAAGADLLCADVAQSMDVPLIAALPLSRADFETDFDEATLARFRMHCDNAIDCYTVPAIEPLPETPSRDFAYRQAGIHVATFAHVLIALWDGEDPTPHGCGTSSAVDFALHGSYRPAIGAAIDASQAVYHIYTPRGDRADAPAGTTRFLGDEQRFDELLARTDEFNRLARQTEPAAYPILETDGSDATLERIKTVHAVAETLSNANGERYRRILALLAAMSTAVTIAFLLYDEVELHWMILVCGIVLLGAFLLSRLAARLACHRRYIEYRMLEESLRVQAYLRYAGSTVQPAALLSWTQKEEAGWVAAALAALGLAGPAKESHSIRDCWIEGQRRYHAAAGKKAQKRQRTSERIVRTALWISVTVYLVSLLFEVVNGLFRLLPTVDAELYRTTIKILLGSVSAATLFVSNYYGKLSLSRKVGDHSKMERFFAEMTRRLAEQGQTDELLAHTAHEELIENGNWCSYQRDNTPDFNL